MVLLPLLLSCTDAPVDSALDCEPTVTWDGWGHGFFSTWCTTCHAPDADRNGAPAGVDFHSPDAVWRQRDAVRRRVIEQQDMPLGGGLDPEDLVRLDALLSCGIEGDITHSPAAPTPELSPDEVAAAVEGALVYGLPESTELLNGVWAVFLEGRDDECPNPDGTLGLPMRFDGCLTLDGWRFAGVSSFVGEHPPIEVGTDYVFDADGFIMAPDGTTSILAGISQREGLYKLTGTWHVPTAEGWLGQGFSGNLQGGGDSAALDVLGSYRVGQGNAVTMDLRFEPLDCPTGTVSLREDSGYWHTVELDCGCGEVRFDGQVTGEVCVELPLATDYVQRAGL